MKQTQTGLLEHSKYFSYLLYGFSHAFPLLNSQHLCLFDVRMQCSGYVPPEYVRNGIYSMKYDVYSFGVLLLQLISGKRNACYYGPNETLSLLEYVSNLIH
jgi:serine/threonine protein kinase